MVGDGLLLAPGSDGSTIEGLDIANFPDTSFTDGAGIHILSNGNLVQSNFLGTDLTGKAAGPGNFYRGLHRRRVEQHDRRRGILGNLISGNSFDGVLIYDNAQPAQHNLVIGNKIGTDVTGTAALPNTGDGIDSSPRITSIGGTSAGYRQPDLRKSRRRDLALTHGEHGPFEQPDSRELRRHRLTGKIALGNGSGGVSDNNGLNNTIGGTSRGAGNLISGNQDAGIILTSDLGR